MLEPQDRRLLRDALRPPDGYDLDRAIVTTFSLDLMALLSVPLAFTAFGMRDQDGTPHVDPLALMESLRHYAGRITLFCQAAEIAVPRRSQLLMGYLEDSVVEVTAPRGGVFHPKVTVLRFTPRRRDTAAGEDTDREPVVYRVLCGSRNLTFDRSWDTLLVLEGALTARRKKAFSRNHPLGDFIGALPSFSVHPLPDATGQLIGDIADEIRRVDFQLPEGYDALGFWAIGIDERKTFPFDGYDRILAMAPFVSDGFLARLSERCGEHVLVSRYESLESLSDASIKGAASVHYLSLAAEQPSEEAEGASPGAEDTGAQAGEDTATLALDPSEQLTGLHAKLFIADAGWDARVWTGSANATDSAFERNVEFLVELLGRKSRCGVDAILRSGTDGERQRAPGRPVEFADLLQPYERTQPLTKDPTQERLDRLLLDVRRRLASAKLSGEVTASSGHAEGFRIAITAPERIEWDGAVEVRCRPISLRPDAACVLNNPSAATMAVFEPVSFEGITAFFALELTARCDGRQQQCAFAMKIPLSGLPSDRPNRILMALLKNREQFLRYLLMLLADDETAAEGLMDAAAGEGWQQCFDPEGGFGLPLLEPLLRSLDRAPERLEQIAGLVEDLRKTAEGRQLLTDDFLKVWEPIWEVQKGETGHGG